MGYFKGIRRMNEEYYRRMSLIALIRSMPLTVILCSRKYEKEHGDHQACECSDKPDYKIIFHCALLLEDKTLCFRIWYSGIGREGKGKIHRDFSP